MSTRSPKNLAFNLAALVVAMFLLAYASVPLYRMFCQVTGFGGTTQQASKLPDHTANRMIKVRFNADIDADLPWEFAPGERERTLQVGAQGLTHYVAHNLADKAVTGHATYNVVPNKAGPYFVKIACFCFTEQSLSAGQKVDMPVSFFIDPSIMDDPEMNDVHEITLSYTFFPVKKTASNR